jgi:uncharacterized protein (TIGR02099 family)
MVKKSLLWCYRITLFSLLAFALTLSLSVLSLRYWVLPHIDQYKNKIVTAVSQSIGKPISIDSIAASWHGLNPHLKLLNVTVYDAQGRPALSLKNVETSLSWLSIPLLEPRLSSLSIAEPELTIRREKNGVIYVAGIAMNGPSRPAFPNWLLKQAEIDVLQATLLWQDDMRNAPPLTLNQLNLHIENPSWEALIGHHRFGLQAVPSVGTQQPIDIRGNFYGKDVAHLEKWHGTLYSNVQNTDMSVWRAWLDYPIDLSAGNGSAHVWLDFAHGKPEKLTSDVVLTNVKSKLAEQLPEATLKHVAGHFVLEQLDDGQSFTASNLQLADYGSLNMKNGYISLRSHKSAQQQSTEGKVNLDALQVDSLLAYLDFMPLSQENKQHILELAPKGQLKSLDLTWKNTQRNPQAAQLEYSIRSQFEHLGLNAYQHYPGFSNLSGSLDANQKNGTLSINSQQASLDFAPVLRWPIPANKLTGQVKWQIGAKQIEIRVSNLAIASPHLTGTINASYTHNDIKGGKIDLTGKFGNVDAHYARFYFPQVLGPETMHWLDTAILAGKGEDVNLTLRGNLHDFPFDGNKNGLFRVTAKITEGELDYAPGWPKIEAAKLNMLFEGNRMELNAYGGKLLGNQISKAKISIPQLHVAQPVLLITGETQGPVSEGIKYINNSPIKDTMLGFTDNLHTSGNGKLDLDLQIPLHDTHATVVKGSYIISNGGMQSDGVPELTRINGKLEFTESALKAQNVNAWAYGGPVQFNLITGKDHIVRIGAKGHATDAGLKAAFNNPLLDKVTGSLDWLASILVADKQVDMTLNSNLLGLASSLPSPLSKASTDSMAFKLEKKPNATQDVISLSLGNIISAKLVRGLGASKIERGEIAINQAANMPTQAGITLKGNLDYVDADEWRALNDTNHSNSDDGLGLNRVDLNINTLDIFDRRINALKLLARPVNAGWVLNLQSREITGDAIWTSSNNTQESSKLSARLKNLIIPSTAPNVAQIKNERSNQKSSSDYPTLDIIAENFEFGKKKLGRLELLSNEQNDDWNIQKLRISNPDSTLTGDGVWHSWQRNSNTQLNLNWAINDLGKTLERFGYPSTIKNGEASLTGQLKWPGSPHEFDIPNLTGQLQLEAHKGQILKIQPGVGRLFSVLSLQNLPRRFTLDFKDVFSSGFTFDKITSNVKIDRGQMHSDDFLMEGPTARVEMHGDTDLQRETQHLFVKVTPYISDSLALAAFAGGPVVGAAAYVTQKLLRDPLNKLAVDEYEIVGTWDNPQEQKSGEIPSNNKPVIVPNK